MHKELEFNSPCGRKHITPARNRIQNKLKKSVRKYSPLTQSISQPFEPANYVLDRFQILSLSAAFHFLTETLIRTLIGLSVTAQI